MRHAIKPTLDSAVKCSYALIPGKKSKNIKGIYSSNLQLAAPHGAIIEFKVYSLHQLHLQLWDIWAEVKMNGEEENVHITLAQE